MFEKNPMFSMNVRIWKYFSVILNRNWRIYGFMVPFSLMNAMQFIYVYRVRKNLEPLTLNIVFAVSFFNALLRTGLVIKNRNQFEAFMYDFNTLYVKIETSDDPRVKRILKDATRLSRKISIFNLTACFIDTICTLVSPFFRGYKSHPFGVALPLVDMTKFPVYEIFYILQLPTPFTLTAMYMTFVNIFASFALFGKALLEILQHKLRNLCRDASRNNKERFEHLRECIKQYNIVVRYVANINSLITNLMALEFVLYSGMICLLLFCINIMETFTQIFAVFMYVFSILFILFTYYWLANELRTESLKVSEAAYDMEWYECSPRFRKTLLIFMQRCQAPLQLMVGNMYPMSLETFQSLLNASYSYFTLLRGANNK